MFDTQHFVTQLTFIFGLLREISIIGVIIGTAWKARGIWDDAKQFFNRFSTHMTTMEEFATNSQHTLDSLAANHLAHIETSLATLADATPKRKKPRC